MVIVAGVLAVLLIFCTLGAGWLWRQCAFLRYESDVYKRVLQLICEPISITDSAGVIVFVNNAFAAMTGYSSEEAVGRKPSLLKSSHHSAEFYCQMWNAISSGKTWRGQMINRRKNGELYVDELTIAPLCNRNGHFTHYVSVRHDVTRNIQSRQQLVAEAEALTIPNQLEAVAHRAQTQEDLLSGTLDVLLSLSELRVDGRAVVFEHAKETSTLNLVMSRGAFSKEFLRDEATVQLGRCLCGQAAVERRVLVCDNCTNDPRHENKWPDMDTHGHYAIPLVFGDEVLGVINLYTRTDIDNSESRILFLTGVGRKVGEAMACLGARRGHFPFSCP